MSRRSKLEQVISVLQALRFNSKQNITRLYVLANINPTIAKKTVTCLVQKGFIKILDTSPTQYSLTPEGLTWLKDYNLIIRELEGINE